MQIWLGGFDGSGISPLLFLLGGGECGSGRVELIAARRRAGARSGNPQSWAWHVAKLADFAKIARDEEAHGDMFTVASSLGSLGLSSLRGSPRMDWKLSPPVGGAPRVKGVETYVRVDQGPDLRFALVWWLCEFLRFAANPPPARRQPEGGAKHYATTKVRISGGGSCFLRAEENGVGDQSTLVAIAVPIAGDSGGGFAISRARQQAIVGAGVGGWLPELRSVPDESLKSAADRLDAPIVGGCAF